MPTSLVADLFISVDGYAGSDGLPGYFGYLGPTSRSGSPPSRRHRTPR